MEKQEQVRSILIDADCPEVGDSIVDAICAVFGYPDTNEFVLPDPATVKSKEQARDLAIDWQHWASDRDLYMSEYADFGDYFRQLGRKYGLIREFKENGIL